MHVVGDQREQIALALIGVVAQRQFQELVVDPRTDVAHDVVAEVADGDHRHIPEDVLAQEEHHHADADHQQRAHLAAVLDQLREEPVEAALEPFTCPELRGSYIHRLHLAEQQAQERDEEQQRSQVEDRGQQVEERVEEGVAAIGRAEAEDPEEVAHR